MKRTRQFLTGEDLYTAVWGKNYHSHHEYVTYMKAVDEGRTIQSVRADLNERLAYQSTQADASQTSGEHELIG